jgi:poly(3-hydroxybutyrate) depolymerase
MRTALILIVLAPCSVAQDALLDALAALRGAPRHESEEAVQAVLATKRPLDEIVQALAARVPVKDPIAAGWHQREATDEEGTKRPYQLYVPESVAGSREPVPLLVSMHGGVGRDEFITEQGVVGAGRLFVESAEESRFACVFPMGKKDCTWWSDAGAAHVRAVVRDVKRFVGIDDDRISATGFSDGGSGCFYLAMAAPDPFAAFLPMNGHPVVASRASGRQLYLRNLRMTPQLVAMTQDDPLYPAATVLPHLEAAMRAGTKVTLFSYPEGEHSPVYFEEQRAAFVRFLLEARREPLPRAIDWWCARPETGRVRWVEVVELGHLEDAPEALEDLNPMSKPGRVRIGIHVDPRFPGPGVRVDRVLPETPAHRMGIEAGDLLVAIDGKRIEGMQNLRRVLARKRYGDPVEATVRREEGARRSALRELTLAGRFPEFVPEATYIRETPAGRVSVRVEGHAIRIVARHVRKLRLRLAPALFGDEPVTVTVNGRQAATKILAVSPEELLRSYARDADSGRLFTRTLVVDTAPR